MISTNYSQQISIINLYIIIYYKFFLSLFYILQFENKLLPHSCTHNITKSKPKLRQKKKKNHICHNICTYIQLQFRDSIEKFRSSRLGSKWYETINGQALYVTTRGV